MRQDAVPNVLLNSALCPCLSPSSCRSSRRPPVFPVPSAYIGFNKFLLMSKSLKKQKDLISRLKNGEEEAFVFLVKTYNKLLFSYAVSLTNDRAMAKDIVQDVFFGIWKDRKKLNTSYSLKNFIFSLKQNLQILRNGFFLNFLNKIPKK